MKKGRMKWAGNVERMGRRMHIRFWWELQRKENTGWGELISTGLLCLTIGMVEDSSKRSNEPSVSTKFWEILEHLCNRLLFKKGSAPLRQLLTFW
jgi:hypothetical protein